MNIIDKKQVCGTICPKCKKRIQWNDLITSKCDGVFYHHKCFEESENMIVILIDYENIGEH